MIPLETGDLIDLDLIMQLACPSRINSGEETFAMGSSIGETPVGVWGVLILDARTIIAMELEPATPIELCRQP